MKESKAVYILGARRTPFGKFWGALKDIPPSMLAAHVIHQILTETAVSGELIEEVYIGQVLTAGEGQNSARQAMIHAGLPVSCSAEGFDKVCSSSLAAMRHAANVIRVGEAQLMLAGGIESMSRAPYLLRRWKRDMGDFVFAELVKQMLRYGEELDMKKAREFAEHTTELLTHFNEDKFIDSMIFDGLCDIYDANLPHMGKLADMCARVQGISREDQMAYAFASFSRALETQRAGLLYSQLVTVNAEDGKVLLDKDEGVYTPDLERWKKSKPAFSEDGTVIAGTSSQVSDGAAVILLGTMNIADKLGLRPMARIVAFAVHSQESNWYTTAPVGAIRKVLVSSGLQLNDIDLFEINEAFAVVPLHAMRELNIPHEKVNIWGGAIAMGHPIGASGARITGTLAHELIATGGRYGIAVACNGGGEAVAVLIENIRR